MRPCMDSSEVCSVSQFISEYYGLFDLDFKIPQSVIDGMGDDEKSKSQCLLLLNGAIKSISETVWLCHKDLKVIMELQEKLSDMVKEATENIKYSFSANYYNDKKFFAGRITLDKKQLAFNSQSSETPFNAEWNTIEPYSVSLHNREVAKIFNDKSEDVHETCFRINLKINEKIDKHYFCISHDQAENSGEVGKVEAEFLSYIYATNINRYIQKSAVKRAIDKIAKNPNAVLVDSNDIFPLKMEVRKKYLRARHKLSNKFRLKEISQKDLEESLVKIKSDIINSVCSNFQVCLKALEYSIDKGHLPLSTSGEKRAFDLQNPYHEIMPVDNIKINLPVHGGLGEKIVETVANIKGIKNYFAVAADKNKSPGNPLDKSNISMALNTLRQNSKTLDNFKNVVEITSGVCADKKPTLLNQRRKISLLAHASDEDMFFNYFIEIIGITNSGQ